VHLGAIERKRFFTPHVWVSVNGKITDLTSITQEIDTVQNMLNGKAIGKRGNGAKRISGRKFDPSTMRQCISNADLWVDSISALSELVKYKDTFIIPKERVHELTMFESMNYD